MGNRDGRCRSRDLERKRGKIDSGGWWPPGGKRIHLLAGNKIQRRGRLLPLVGFWALGREGISVNMMRRALMALAAWIGSPCKKERAIKKLWQPSKMVLECLDQMLRD